MAEGLFEKGSAVRGSAVDACVGPVLFSAEQIAARVRQLGQEIGDLYTASDGETAPLVVAILKGSVIFVGDLMRAMDIPLEVEFLAVSSYGAAKKSSGVVRVGTDIDRDIAGRDILVVEDIVDSGATLSHLSEYFRGFEPRSITTCSLLFRRSLASDETSVDYWGFDIESDAFVVGYGLDYDQRYRNLPHIAQFLTP